MGNVKRLSILNSHRPKHRSAGPYIFATPLCEFAFKYGTDKCPQIGHQYTPFYFEMFNDRKEKIKKVVEMGIGWGASLYMWRDFFSNAQIFGADNDPELIFNDERIQTFLLDQSDKNDLYKLIRSTGSDIDLFIDDGSHKPEDQVITCLTLMPLLDKNVTYVIEDVGHIEIADKLGEYDLTFKRRSKLNRHDDRLLVVRHKK